MYQRIIVPLDGSDLAEGALGDAEQLARLTGATLLLIRVVGYPTVGTAGIGSWELQQSALATLIEEATRDAETYLAEVEKRISAADLTVTTEIRRGLVVPAILHETHPGDVIVMTTHGRGGIKRWFMGSVAEDVVRQATVPVLLVRVGPHTEL